MRQNTRGLLWVDKYRPVTLQRLDYHNDLTNRLKMLAQRSDVPHLLFYGPPGSGKRTRVFAFLREVYGTAVEKLKVEHRSFKVGDPPKEVEMTTVSSAYHIEANPSDAGNSDRLIVQELIKEIASSAPLDVTAVKQPFKVIVLHEVDSLSRLAQQALRRTMEKYSRTCRIIMVADSLTKVIEPLRSRCNMICVPAPSESEICAILQNISRQECFALPDSFAKKLVVSSESNLRRAILQLQSSKSANYPFSEEQDVSRADWELVCTDIASLMMREQSNKRLLFIRSRFYELLAHAIPADTIFEKVTTELLRNIDQDIAPAVCQCAAQYEHRLRVGQKAIIHLEAFAARFMQIYKVFINSQYSMLIDDDM